MVWSIYELKEVSIDINLCNNSMHAYFDSPDTIRNKVKEFKTATFNGLNKQDVMNYLSVLAEQQGVMIRLLRENNIPLFVDDGYEQEEQFEKPATDGQDYLNQYLGGNDADVVSEMHAEIEALKAENEALKLASLNIVQTTPTAPVDTDFDAQYGLVSSTDEVSSLKQAIEEKDLYIKELELAISGDSNNSNLLDGTNATELNDIERQAYEEEITNLRNELESLKSSETTPDLFETEVVQIDEDVKAAYEKEIEDLKVQLDEANAKIELNSSNENEAELQPFVLDEPIDTAKEDEAEELHKTIDDLTSTVSELKAELDACHAVITEMEEAKESEQVEEVQPLVEDVTTPETESNEQMYLEQIDSLKTTVEILELEVSKKDKEKAEVEFKIEEVVAELSKYKNFKDDNGEIISIEPEMLISKHKEVVAIEERILSEKQEIENKINALQATEEKIEANKHLISDDYVKNMELKEQEIDKLRKQMDRMLLVAQTTADETEKEANIKATNIIDEATSKANAILDHATDESNKMMSDASTTLDSAKEFKANTEAELAKFREETRQNAEELILSAQNKANEVLENAKAEAEKTQEEALEEVEKIMSQAENKVAEIDAIIQSKQKEIDNMQKYYLKVKNDGLVGVKKLYNQLENIIYSDEQLS